MTTAARGPDLRLLTGFLEAIASERSASRNTIEAYGRAVDQVLQRADEFSADGAGRR